MSVNCHKLVEDLVAGRGAFDNPRQSVDEIFNIGEVELFTSIAIHAQLRAGQSAFYEDLTDAAADATAPIKCRRSNDGIRQAENLLVGDDDFLGR